MIMIFVANVKSCCIQNMEKCMFEQSCKHGNDILFAVLGKQLQEASETSSK